jgi:hypothetical protein
MRCARRGDPPPLPPWVDAVVAAAALAGAAEDGRQSAATEVARPTSQGVVMLRPAIAPLPVSDVAEALAVSERTVRNLIRHGTCPSDPSRNVRLEAFRVGAVWRVRPEALAAFEAALRELSR